MFKVSTNITRDFDSPLNFIVTKNTNEVYDRIVFNYAKGQSSFTIIGSYGTGKSTFLWAFENHLKGHTKFNQAVNGEFKGFKKFDFKRIVGESNSFKQRFCEEFGLSKYIDTSNKAILTEFKLLCEEINASKRVLVILVDEFGKHLEYIAKHNPEEMYFIQELAEFCNDQNRQVLFITTLHQNFSVYSRGLSQAEKSEWDKVKGRLIDIAFDEPVEQLLFFASKRLQEYKVPNNFKKEYATFISRITTSNLLGKGVKGMLDTLEDLYPLDPLSADILTKSLQRYGQNERSLFSFLESSDLHVKINAESTFSVADCFDYLVSNLVSEIEDGEKNPFKPQWKAASLALEKAEFIFEKDFESASKLIKTICLVNIFSPSSGTLDDSILATYGGSILGVSNTQEILNKLIDRRIIKFSNHRKKYNFIDGTDVDIEQELINATQYVDREFDLVSRLASYFEFGILPAKRIQFEKGTPRFFQFKFHGDIQIESPSAEIDGYINLIFSKRRILKNIQEFANTQSPAQIFVLFKEVEHIEETIFEIDKINFVANKFAEDKVALRILNEEKLFRSNKLKAFVEGALFSNEAKVTWVWNSAIDALHTGAKRQIHSYRELNKLLSDAAQLAYPKTPVYRNEMVNKEFLSTPLLTARKALLRRLIAHGNEEDLGFGPKQFPPEKTIYLSLLKNTGIHRFQDMAFFFGAPNDASFKPLWDACEEVLCNAKDAKLAVAEFYNVLRSGEFKLKQGFLDFWIPVYLVLKKEDYALYHKDGDYIPHLTSEVLDLVYKHPSKYLVKALTSEGVESNYLTFYKELTGYNESNIQGLQSSYITIYSNFLRFYRGLEEYTRKTKTGLSKAAQGVRDAIAHAKDPETALFKAIPEALGYFGLQENDKKLQNFLLDLQEVIREIRGCYDLLVEQLEKNMQMHLHVEESQFDSFKSRIIDLFSSINPSQIANDKVRIFHARVISPLDVRKAYWESLCDATLGKKLNQINDEEIDILNVRMKGLFSTLLDLVDIHSFKKEQGEKVFQVSILSDSADTDLRKNILASNENNKKAELLEEKIKVLLEENKEVNQLALLRLLEKELHKK